LKYAGLVKFKSDPNNKSSVYQGAYWGTQRLSSMPEQVKCLVESNDQYLDITAGGGGWPFYWAERGKVAGGNDRSFYAYSMLDAVLCNRTNVEEPRDEWFDNLCSQIHPDNVPPMNGFLSKMQESEKPQLKLSVQTAGYIDGLAGKFKDTLVLSALGKTMMGTFTFRGFCWCNIMANKKMSDTVTPEQLFLKIARQIWKTRIFGERAIKWKENQVTNFNLFEPGNVRKIHWLPNSVCYSDPAWPWSNTLSAGQKNPYVFLTVDLPSVLLQEQQEMPRFWETNTPLDEVLIDLRRWFNEAFEGGAKYFVLSTQDTNNPKPEEVYAELSRDFKPIWIGKMDQQSSFANYIYKDNFGIFTGG